MGSLPDNDAAITKWAYLAASLLELKHGRRLPFTLELRERMARAWLRRAGFLPTHGIEGEERMSAASPAGIEQFAGSPAAARRAWRAHQLREAAQ
jgi:hypothetical protein